MNETRRSKTGRVRRRLARELAAGTDIETTSGTEHTEWVKLGEFPGTSTFFASDKDETAKKARRHMDGSDKQSFWVDGSPLDT